jgi:hypothetical protein
VEPSGIGRIHRSAWNEYSRKFKVASAPSRSGAGSRARHGGASLESERRDLVAFVAPLCIKGLRLVTLQLPENFSPIGLRLDRTSPNRGSLKFGCTILHSPGPVRHSFLCRESEVSTQTYIRSR